MLKSWTISAVTWLTALIVSFVLWVLIIQMLLSATGRVALACLSGGLAIGVIFTDHFTTKEADVASLTLRPGILAWYDTPFHGLVSVRVLTVEADPQNPHETQVTMRVTNDDVRAYPKGEVFTASRRDMCARPVRVDRNGHIRVRDFEDVEYGTAVSA